MRDPHEILLDAQLYLMYLRRPLKNREQKEWDSLTDAVIVIEKCLKQLEK